MLTGRSFIFEKIMAVRQNVWDVKTRTNFTGSDKLIRAIQKGVGGSSTDPRNPYNIAFKEWGEIYRAFLRARFNENKSGGAKWPRIAKRTEKWRLARYGIKHKKILFVTQTLYKITDKKYDKSKGHYEKRTKYGITVGAAGGRRHPDYPGSLFDLVLVHARGRSKSTRKVKRFGKEIKGQRGGAMPKREIVVPASAYILRRMGIKMEAAHKIAVKKANQAVK